MPVNLLGDVSQQTFMRRYWQKRPLLVRGAFAGRSGIVSLEKLASLARKGDVESRLVRRSRGRWRVSHGPLAPRVLERAGGTDWTLLVSGVNLHVPAADRLLRRFDFLPQARIDDVMVSYAVPGGGVGPHADSYDVFLLQARGRRVWRICRPRPFAEVPDAPLRLIDGFRAEDELLVEPGDLLYLPPGWGHDGIAIDAGFTYSVGFRAPRGDELAAAFLDWMHERGLPDADYRDHDARVTLHPAQLPTKMLSHAGAVLARMRWSSLDVKDFLGEFLSTPKPIVQFNAPRRANSFPVFVRRLRRGRVVLDARTQLLYHGGNFYVNGEGFAPRARLRKALRTLADGRRLQGRVITEPELVELLHRWYGYGFVHVEQCA